MSLPYPNSEHVELRGVRTHVQSWDPEGIPAATVVAHHHFYGSAQTFHRLGPRLAARGLRLVAFDRVGFGLTERPDPGGRWIGPDSPYTRAFAVLQTLELLDRLEVAVAIVTGTSMGGTITLEFALAHPDRVAHAIPVSAPLEGDAAVPATWRPVLRRPALAGLGAALVRRGAGRIDAARVGKSWLDPSRVEADDVDAHGRFRESDGWARGLWWKLVADEPPSLLPRLPELAAAGVAVTAVGATGDRVVRPRVAERIARDTGGRYMELSAGHVVHLEAPDALADVVVGAVDAV